MELERKLSPKTVFGGPEAIKKALGNSASVGLYHVVGMVMGTKSGSSQYGEWLAFRGRFETRHCETGEVKQSSILFMPEVATDMLLSEMATGATMIGFAFEIGARKPRDGETAPTGYVYTVKPISKPSETDALEDLRKLLPAPLEK